ncbi:MAG: hypothetical protein JWM27_3548 [Gemmatimonadetes bacterium]|nr:hypothetical protein [Gemmatimonadota bacterium]
MEARRTRRPAARRRGRGEGAWQARGAAVSGGCVTIHPHRSGAQAETDGDHRQCDAPAAPPARVSWRTTQPLRSGRSSPTVVRCASIRRRLHPSADASHMRRPAGRETARAAGSEPRRWAEMSLRPRVQPAVPRGACSPPGKQKPRPGILARPRFIILPTQRPTPANPPNPSPPVQSTHSDLRSTRRPQVAGTAVCGVPLGAEAVAVAGFCHRASERMAQSPRSCESTRVKVPDTLVSVPSAAWRMYEMGPVA